MKYLLITILAVLTLAGFLAYQYISFNNGKLHIVFCNVGQGDGILVRTPGQKYILIDSGPDKSVLDCLSRHMPLWQRTIDLAVLSHPHSDHFTGFHYVSDRYSIKAFATEKLDNKTPGFQLLMQKLKDKQIPIRYVLTGDKFGVGDGVYLAVDGPTPEYLDLTSPGGQIGESKEFASVITRISYGTFSTLLAGDSQAVGLEQAYKQNSKPVTILQAPHHGSATGLSAELLEKFAPKLAVISVGKNTYGHPSLATLYLLKDIPTKRTDKAGDIEIVSDGKEWRSTR